MVKTKKPFDPAEMDNAAKDAANDLGSSVDKAAVDAVAGWFGRWYMKAGHKRLGRLLVSISKGNSVPKTTRPKAGKTAKK